MNEGKTGQRMLMALMSNSDEVTNDGFFSVQGLILAVASSLCLIVLVILCTCRDKKTKVDENADRGKANEQPEVVTIDLLERKTSQDGQISVENGGSQSNRNSANMSKHSRQPSSASGNNIRPPSLRELPEPPVTAHHSRNTSVSGVQNVTTSGVVASGGDEILEKCALPPKDSNVEDDDYDHLGPKRAPSPTDYDKLGPAVVTPDLDTPVSEVSSGMDGHYSQPKERMYAVCKDVRPKTIPTFEFKDKEQITSNHYSHVTEEDPYNQINESGGTLPSDVIQRIRQSNSVIDPDDPYATVQDESGGSYKAIIHAVGGARAQPALPVSPSSPPEFEAGEDEYAVVQKVNGPRSHFPSEEKRVNSEDEISPYSIRPPEPPRLYEGYVEDEHIYDEGSDQSTNSKEHKYSKVTARESLASMSARNALNTYETLADIPENTYATVEGGSGDGIVQDVTLRNRVAGMTELENRLSQNSDTYAEIAISGGGLTSSVISNTSTSSNANANILGTSSGSSGAPIPPSLDSLPQMSKSLTSSEGDRLSDKLSDRFLGSPDDRLITGQFDDLGSSDNDGEDGYSTLTRDGASSSLRGDASRLINNVNSENPSNGQDNSEDSGNDPNYESVDELRAKFAYLKVKDESGRGMNSAPHISVVSVNRKDPPTDWTQSESDKTSESQNPRRRRPRHDYEEVDVSPPQSPQTSLPQVSECEITNAEAVRERVLNGHTYEEVAQVQTKKGQAKKTNTSESKKKSSSSEEKDRKKSKEEKKKNKSDEKKKNSESNRGNAWDGSKKSNSWEANRTRL